MRGLLSPALAPTRQRLQANKCVKNVRWTKEEDEILVKIVSEQETPNWSVIALSFPQKTTQQVTERWEKVLNPTLVKGSWTREEDEIIIRFVREFGCKNWTRLAGLLKGRLGKQCRERWRNHLDPSINHANWNNEEDQRLIALHRQYGNSWVKISKLMPGRSDNQIKNRWNSIRKKTEEVKPVVETVIPFEKQDIHAETSVPVVSLMNPFSLSISPNLLLRKEDSKERVNSSPRVDNSVENHRAKLVLLMEEY